MNQKAELNSGFRMYNKHKAHCRRKCCAKAISKIKIITAINSKHLRHIKGFAKQINTTDEAEPTRSRYGVLDCRWPFLRHVALTITSRFDLFNAGDTGRGDTILNS
ncbi:hypothetical protein GPALN_015015 [Globodera pallida]|nr:hypothetical protein GPALN_015015 [Globodera pallida]